MIATDAQVRKLNAVKLDENVKQLDEIAIGYVTDMFPRRVEMLFTIRPGSTGTSSLGYTAREQEDGSRAIRFVATLASMEGSGNSCLTDPKDRRPRP